MSECTSAEEKVDNRESKIGQIKTTRYLAKFKINLNFLSYEGEFKSLAILAA